MNSSLDHCTDFSNIVAPEIFCKQISSFFSFAHGLLRLLLAMDIIPEYYNWPVISTGNTATTNVPNLSKNLMLSIL